MGSIVVLLAGGDCGLTWVAAVKMEKRLYLRQSKSSDGPCFILFCFSGKGGRKILLRR